MPFGDYPDVVSEQSADINQLSASARRLYEQACAVGHPDPLNATWGDVNLLSVVGFGTKLSPEEARHVLRVAEFDADF